MKYEPESKTASRSTSLTNLLWNVSLVVLALSTPAVTILLSQNSLVSLWI